ncbi:hypothetical protein J2755_001313 [Methanohalophilus levihalophilus]|uniref:hypothetical protein n=1 Tax=Methanohalophilus levihalophilus TaxID=1431282 RepID=UPI001AE10988|nr:hypothetical protein [Methanohalophilus levihalophilus]MBP2030379.1 hypothetical protein [Methanohalophilus levihalophilus]
MAFDAVVFGTYVVGTGFTVGDSISSGGFRCFIVPQATIGDAPLDVTITYVDQFGNSQTADVSTSVEAYKTSGSHIEIALNAGDTGIRSVSAVSVTGGTTADEFTLESWNEGLGGSLALESSDASQPDSNTGLVGVREFSPAMLLEEETENDLMFTEGVTTLNVDYDGDMFTLQTEQIAIYPENSAHVDTDDGFLPGMFTLDNSTMSMKLDLADESDYNKVDETYMNKGFEIIASGFIQITFDYEVVLNSSYFIAELVDSEGTVKWSKTGTASGTGQVVTFVDDYCVFRVRCIAPNSPSVWTSPVDPWDNHMYIGNVVLDRYKTSGYIEQTGYKYKEFMKALRIIDLGYTLGTADTQVKAQIDVGDSLASTSGFVGPDGTSSTYYTDNNGKIWTGAAAGKYWRTKVWLTGDGKYTPSFDFIWYYFDMWIKHRLLSFPDTNPATVLVPVDFHPLVIESSQANQPDSQFFYLSKNEMLHSALTTDIEISLEHTADVDNKTGEIGLSTYRINKEVFDATDFVYGCITSGVVFNNSTFELEEEEIEPDYSTEIDEDDGFLSCNGTVDAGNKELKIDLLADTTYTVIDSNYPNHGFIWQESGFLSVEFDYDVNINSSYFILELLDADGTVVWSKSGTTSGTGQVVTMNSTKFHFRLRCKANYTTPTDYSEGITVSNIKITRYPTTGLIEMPWYLWREHNKSLDIFYMSITEAVGCDIRAQIYISDDQSGTPNSGWIGPDGTSTTSYSAGYTPMNSAGYAGKYYKLKIMFTSDGMHTPTFHRIEIQETMYIYLRHLKLATSWSESSVGVVMSGYAIDQESNPIMNAIKVILESTYVFGRDTMGVVNPETGFYQIFVKDAYYDKRHLILQVPGKTTNLSLRGYGTPDAVDATSGIPENQDLQFWKAPLCKSVAHVDSLVTY